MEPPGLLPMHLLIALCLLCCTGAYFARPQCQTPCCWILQIHIIVHQLKRPQCHKNKRQTRFKWLDLLTDVMGVKLWDLSLTLPPLLACNMNSILLLLLSLVTMNKFLPSSTLWPTTGLFWNFPYPRLICLQNPTLYRAHNPLSFPNSGYLKMTWPLSARPQHYKYQFMVDIEKDLFIKNTFSLDSDFITFSNFWSNFQLINTYIWPYDHAYNIWIYI